MSYFVNCTNTLRYSYLRELVWFEGTPLSVGRGTDFPFQVVGSPDLQIGAFTFTPAPRPGAKQPQGLGQVHHGDDLRAQAAQDISHAGLSLAPFSLAHLLRWHATYKAAGKPFFTRADFFDKLAGTDALRIAIENGADEKQIRAQWQSDLQAYRAVREKYRIYR